MKEIIVVSIICYTFYKILKLACGVDTQKISKLFRESCEYTLNGTIDHIYRNYELYKSNSPDFKYSSFQEFLDAQKADAKEGFDILEAKLKADLDKKIK